MATQTLEHAPAHSEHGLAHAAGAHEETNNADYRVSMAILAMVSLLAVLFALVVPTTIVLLYHGMGY